ncbi:YniB-like protein [Pseudomonas flavescens]|uniref:YniB-like protein n=1 Tax=Phytopseudomonas flavescens TaxID=29435 RepID=A0A1G8DJ88_9GAMM|nr:YniB family protein [Pseudomonas flavescens]SDH57529.1 YniB-like protein [Pseudomonas flavescens]
MNYRQARQKALSRVTIGLLISLAALAGTMVSLMKMIYFRLDSGSALSGILTGPFQNLISFLYYQPWFPKWLWKIAPAPDPLYLGAPENVKFAAIYLGVFVGAAILSSGRKSQIRLATINEEIEHEVLRQSLRGESAQRSRAEMEERAVIPKQSIFGQVHQLYIAPIVVGILVALVLRFGFAI